MELMARRDSVIVVPNQAVVESKRNVEVPGGKVIPVMEGISDSQVACEIEKCHRHRLLQKIVTTYEGVQKVKSAIWQLNGRPCEYFWLVDEQQQQVTDNGYRAKIIEPLDFIFRQQKKAFISATPAVTSDPRYEEQGFRLIEIEPQWDITIQAEMRLTESPLLEIACYVHHIVQAEKEMGLEQQPIHVFLNSPRDITYCVQRMQQAYPGMIDADDIRLFCSKESIARLKKEGSIRHAYSNWNPAYMGRINFFTCRFYVGFDLILPEGVRPHVVIASHVRQAEHTIVCPVFDAIQIQGRFRRGYQDLCIITDWNPAWPALTQEQVETKIDTFRNIYERVQAMMVTADTPEARGAIESVLEKMPYRELVSNPIRYGELYRRDLYRHTELLKSDYRSPETILEAYRRTGRFRIKAVECNYSVMSDELWINSHSKNEFITEKELMMQIVERLKTLNPAENIADAQIVQDISRQNELTQFVVEAWRYLGAETFERYHWTKHLINKELILRQAEENLHGDSMRKLVYNKFLPGFAYPQNEIRAELRNMVERLGIKMGRKLDSSDIKNYFSVQPGETKMTLPNGSRARCYRLLERKM